MSTEPGCDYCRVAENRLTDGLAGNEEEKTYLLRCPACGQHYGGFAFEPHFRPPLTPAEVKQFFPDYDS